MVGELPQSISKDWEACQVARGEQELSTAKRGSTRQKASDEGIDRQRGPFVRTGFAFGVAKRDLAVLDTEETIVAQRYTKDVGRQILQGGAATTDRTAIDHPVHLPDLRRDAA